LPVVLEIGTWKGFSTELWWNELQPHLLITLEKDNENPDGIRIISNNIHYLFNSDSHDINVIQTVKRILDNQPVNFLFIDGDHSYNGVKQDFEMYLPLVKSPGIIAFHDALYHADKTEEVDMFWQEIKKEYPFVEIKVSKESTGIGVIFV
jgi:predicted O-methyltransferase YrrM